MSEQIKIVEKKLLSDNWYKLYRYTYEIKQRNGGIKTERREAYDRGNGATILLYNRAKRTVILTRQFRLPTFVNGNPDGMMIEACAGLLDENDPEECIRRETEEETGYRVETVRRIFEAYMSPGSVTEILYFFVGEYHADQRVHEGGGVEGEEDIDVLEIPFEEALAMMGRAEIRDAKTIMLLQYAQIHGLLTSPA